MHTDIEARLKKLSKTELVQLVGHLYGMDDQIDEVIERHLAAGAVSEQGLEAILFQQLEQLRRDDDFIDYHSGSAFAQRLGALLGALLGDIAQLLGSRDLQQAIRLTGIFMELHEVVLNRADDSDGYVGDVFREAVDVWLDLAAKLRSQQRDAEDWVERVLYFFNHNEYGIYDSLLSGSAGLLTEQELRHLAGYFEDEARKALARPKNSQQYNAAAARARNGLNSVAAALQDMALYETSYLLEFPEPNSHQLESLILFALDIGNWQRADYWLKQPQWQQDQRRQHSLYCLWLQRQGRVDELKQVLLEDFTRHPTTLSLDAILPLVNEQEKQSITQQVEALDRQATDPATLIQLLLMLDRVDTAAEILLLRHQSLERIGYTTLLEWIDIFEQQDQLLAQVICYRALLTDLLARGYSRAYHHGARYFNRLLQLDRQVIDYRQLGNAQTFIRQLQDQHGRKRSFWVEAGYPNKPA
ncbi:MAG: hypothetical protein IBX50_16720 [Marinospirillum sp.]|nr:hypothetical protein [Marinospirillum sp.]